MIILESFNAYGLLLHVNLTLNRRLQINQILDDRTGISKIKMKGITYIYYEYGRRYDVSGKLSVCLLSYNNPIYI